MTEADREKLRLEIYDMAGIGIKKMMEGAEDAPKAADVAIALRWVDGLGSKGVNKAVDNEYAMRTRKALEGQKLPKLDDGDDAASHEV